MMMRRRQDGTAPQYLTAHRTPVSETAWWCTDARTALLHSIWQHTGHQSLRLHDDAPMPGRHCSAVSDSTLDTSLWDCVMAASSSGCQPSTDSSVTSTGCISWSGVRCRRSVDVQLTVETFYATLLTVLLLVAVFLLRVLMYTVH